jgi:hypothetical protein
VRKGERGYGGNGRIGENGRIGKKGRIGGNGRIGEIRGIKKEAVFQPTGDDLL